jgi:hypothetical protein
MGGGCDQEKGKAGVFCHGHAGLPAVPQLTPHRQQLVAALTPWAHPGRGTSDSSCCSGGGRAKAARRERGCSDAGSQLDSGSEAGEECTICLCAFADGELIKRLPCGHAYHSQCIDTWLHKSATCPLW